MTDNSEKDGAAKQSSRPITAAAIPANQTIPQASVPPYNPSQPPPIIPQSHHPQGAPNHAYIPPAMRQQQQQNAATGYRNTRPVAPPVTNTQPAAGVSHHVGHTQPVTSVSQPVNSATQPVNSATQSVSSVSQPVNSGVSQPVNSGVSQQSRSPHRIPLPASPQPMGRGIPIQSPQRAAAVAARVQPNAAVKAGLDVREQVSSGDRTGQEGNCATSDLGASVATSGLAKGTLFADHRCLLGYGISSTFMPCL